MEIKLQSEHTQVLLSLIEKTEQNIKVMVINSVEYIGEIRRIVPNADITAVINGEEAVDKSRYEGLGIHWINENYLSNSIPVQPESFDVIIGEDLFFRSCNPVRMASLLSTCLSETGYVVVSFANSLYWKSVVETMRGNSDRFIDRVFTDESILDVLHNAKFQDINFTPVVDCSNEGKACIEQLVSGGFDNTSNILSVKMWCVKALKFYPDKIEFKRRYGKNVRWTLVTRLLRVEYGIDSIDTTNEILHLADKEAIATSDIVVFIFNHVHNVGQFMSNFVPGFYRAGRIKLLRELLDVMVDFYRANTDYDTIIEWKKCIDELDEYPDELLPSTDKSSSIVNDASNVLPEKKVAFIACVNDEEWYHETQLYINNLNVPDGMAIELVPIRGAKSICQGYNLGMKHTDAKYKVYLHQDVLITNRDFISDMLDIFADKTIGAMGVIGAQNLPSNGVWWDTSRPVGRALQIMDPESILKYRYPEFDGNCMDVEAVDGIMIATQVDIPWREDLFTGWHFYDISQCKEMQRHGYRVVVPQQDDFWCIHCSAPKLLDDSYDKYQQVFMEEYMERNI
ncbi:Glycosyltransferase like family protein [Anaerovibrio lipolyticus DSM 3074]|uniref:Glycosyltransferase like family protein n=1 Tax=Anaerovibrio lipolyticus DSM 3074 TaxID=1120997 RepID=A0A1M6G305_9FIRM|nr:Glycosyltransferase like family protein [Anaerovibrio lipolyticus DSM 3074]